MQLGWCGTLAQAGQVRDAGYDYIELPLNQFDLESRGGLDQARRLVKTAPLPVPLFNSFFPRDFRIVGPDVDVPRIKDYVGRCAALAHDCGIRAVILGSGWTRIVPDGFSRADAETQLLECFGWCADAFHGSGAVVAIEAQNRKETNIITTLAEAMRYARAVDRPEIRIMADFYHMDEERELLSDLKAFADWIVHVQLADTGRLNPGTGSYDYDSFFKYLKQGGYKGRVSVECMVDIAEAQMRHSQTFLRPYCAAD